MQDNVTQADRNAAANLHVANSRKMFAENYAEAIRQGLRDSDSMVQAFAAHRVASTTAQSEAVQKLVEAVEREAKKADELAAHAVERDFDAMGEALDNMRHRLEAALAAHRESHP